MKKNNGRKWLFSALGAAGILTFLYVTGILVDVFSDLAESDYYRWMPVLIVFTVLLSYAAGFFAVLPHFLSERRKTGRWHFVLPRFLLVFLPVFLLFTVTQAVVLIGEAAGYSFADGFLSAFVNTSARVPAWVFTGAIFTECFEKLPAPDPAPEAAEPEK